MTSGIYSLNDLLAARFNTGLEIGLDTINSVIQNQISYLRDKVVAPMLADLCASTTAQAAVVGTTYADDMQELDEYGHADPKKFSTGYDVAFPIRHFGYRLGWDYRYFKRATGAEIAKNYLQAQNAYLSRLTGEIQKALCRYANYNFTDKQTNGLTLAVKRMWNTTDGVTEIPPTTPAGTTFAYTHDHYVGEASLTATFVQAMIDNVLEHTNTRGVKVFIPAASLATFVAMTSEPGFIPLSKDFLRPLSTDSAETNQTIGADVDYENYQVGFWSNGIPVYVKPWLKTYYHMCVATGMPNKALMYRQFAGEEGLRVFGQDPDYPLFAQDAESDFGFGVYDRGMAAMLYSNNATWANMV